MKKITLIALLICATALNAQVYRNSKFWSMALNVGGHAFHSHKNVESIKFYQPSHIHLNAAYKFNHIYGIRPNFNFHSINVEGATNVKYANFTIDGTIDWNQMGTYGFREMIHEFSVVSHFGFGLSTMWQDRKNQTDPYIKNHDDMLTWSVGITPRLRLSRNMLLNFDMTYVFHHLQDQYFDFTQRKARGFGGGFMRYSFGITYEFIN